MDSTASQAPSSPGPSVLSYNSIDMASLFKGRRSFLIKHLLDQEKFLIVFLLPSANSGF